MDFQALIQDYLDGELTKQQHAELSAWLRESEANREAFVRASMLDTHILGQLQNADLHQFLDQVDIHAIQGAMRQSPSNESGAFVAMMDADATERPNDDFTLAQSLSILTRAGTEFASKRLRQHAITAGLAAAIVIALTLVFVFQGGGNTPTTELAQTPDKIVPPKLTQAQTVATLTATHDAQWSGLRPAVGDGLHADQSLTLVSGFAEIRTNRGAVAILEAPATIEFTNNDNAIRLQAGKLVGICETPASKGFLVRTPHANITDLGTRFGVIVSDQASSVRVLEGEVEVVALLADLNVPPVQLATGQSALVKSDASQVVLSDEASERFVYHWQSLAATPELTGAIRYEASIPVDLRIGASEAQDVRVFHERSDVVLERPVDVNITAPGRHAGQDWIKTQPLSQATVDSYFIHFDCEDNLDEVSKRTVSIRFDRPILGVITTSEQLAASQETLGVPGVRYGNQSDWSPSETHDGRDGSGLDISLSDANQGTSDIVQLSEDRRTLTLDLTVVKAIDQVRVLVQSNPTDQ